MNRVLMLHEFQGGDLPVGIAEKRLTGKNSSIGFVVLHVGLVEGAPEPEKVFMAGLPQEPMNKIDSLQDARMMNPLFVRRGGELNSRGAKRQ